MLRLFEVIAAPSETAVAHRPSKSGLRENLIALALGCESVRSEVASALPAMRRFASSPPTTFQTPRRCS